MFDTDVSMPLSIGPTLLRFAASQVEDDPGVRKLLRELDGVRIRVYEINGDVDRVAARLDAMHAKLGERDWVPAVEIREPGERVFVLIKEDRGGIAGLTLLSSDGTEVVIVNLMGDLQPDMLGDTLTAFGPEAGDAWASP